MHGLSLFPALRLTGLALLLVGVVPGAGRAAIAVGSARAEVIAELGEPELEYTRKGTRILVYYGMEIDLNNGVVARLPHHFQRELDTRLAKRHDDQAQIAKGLINVNGQWVEPPPEAPRRSPRVVRSVTPRERGTAKVISNGGRKVNLGSYIGKGKVTIVDFYADWCGPCRVVSPHLEQLAADPQVDLVKIDIVNWSTPVAKQYGLKSIPNVRVFDRHGRMVGKPTHDVNAVKKYVANAR